MTEINLDGAKRGTFDEATGEYEWWKKLDDTYWVSSFGRVWSCYKGGPMKTRIKDNYVQVQLKHKYKSIHRLVAIAFLLNPDSKPQVNHKDGDKQNNHVSNLEWCTNQENVVHARENDLHKTGKYLNEKERQKVFDLYMTGEYTQNELGKRFGISTATVRKIVSGLDHPRKPKTITRELGRKIADTYHSKKIFLRRSC